MARRQGLQVFADTVDTSRRESGAESRSWPGMTGRTGARGACPAGLIGIPTQPWCLPGLDPGSTSPGAGGRDFPPCSALYDLDAGSGSGAAGRGLGRREPVVAPLASSAPDHNKTTHHQKWWQKWWHFHSKNCVNRVCEHLQTLSPGQTLVAGTHRGKGKAPIRSGAVLRIGGTSPPTTGCGTGPRCLSLEHALETNETAGRDRHALLEKRNRFAPDRNPGTCDRQHHQYNHAESPCPLTLYRQRPI